MYIYRYAYSCIFLNAYIPSLFKVSLNPELGYLLYLYVLKTILLMISTWDFSFCTVAI